MQEQQVEVRMVYPKQIAYRLGDFEGSRVDRLRSKYHAEIYVSKCVGSCGYISVVATTKQIAKVLSKLVWNFTGVLRLTPGKLDERKIRRSSCYISFKLLLKNDVNNYTDQVLDDIGESSQTKIVSYSVDCPECFDRVVDITGTPTDCVKCITKLLKQMKTTVAGLKSEDVYEPLFIGNTIEQHEVNADEEDPDTEFQCDYRLDKFNTDIERNFEDICNRLDEFLKTDTVTKRKIDDVNDGYVNDADGVVTNKKRKTNNDN